MTLTPVARAIAALALAVTVILGSWVRTGFSFSQLLGGPDNPELLAVLVTLVPLAVAALAYWLAQSALGAGAPDATETSQAWLLNVGGAARLLAAVAMVMTFLEMLAGVVGHGPYLR
ncbi:MAG TPA: hypothetical protein VFK34_01750 [Marmoricola sp.]|jgi:hypothetical protein|nr:hypothetical protein [Marmoricola sp.]